MKGLEDLEDLKKRVVEAIEKGKDTTGLKEEADAHLSDAEERFSILDDIHKMLRRFRVVKKVITLIPLLVLLSGCITIEWTPYLGDADSHNQSQKEAVE